MEMHSYRHKQFINFYNVQDSAIIKSRQLKIIFKMFNVFIKFDNIRIIMYSY